MRHTLLIYFLFSSLFSTECSAPLLGAAHSGAPGEVNCSGCHSGVINSGPGIVDYLIGTGNSFYSSSEILTIILSIEESNLNQFGFQTVALRSSNNANAGNFIITDEDETRLIEDDHNGTDRLYVGHTICGADTDNPGSKQWTFQWQAPEDNIGDIEFYLSAISTNHNHSTSGDNTYIQIINLSYNETISGDLNQDLFVNVLDIVQLVGIILGNIDMEPHHLGSSDLNNDGQLNVIDIVSLVNLIIGN